MDFIGPVIFATAAPIVLCGVLALIIHITEKSTGYRWTWKYGPDPDALQVAVLGPIIGGLMCWGQVKALHRDGITFTSELTEFNAAWDTLLQDLHSGSPWGPTIAPIVAGIANALALGFMLGVAVLALRLLRAFVNAVTEFATHGTTSAHRFYERTLGQWHKNVQAEIHDNYGWTTGTTPRTVVIDRDSLPVTEPVKKPTTAEHAARKGRDDILRAFIDHGTATGTSTDTWDDLTPEHRATVLKQYANQAITRPFNPANVQTSPDYLHHRDEDVAAAYTRGIEQGTAELIRALNDYRRREKAAGRALSLAGETVQAALELDPAQDQRKAHRAFDSLMHMADDTTTTGPDDTSRTETSSPSDTGSSSDSGSSSSSTTDA